MILKIKTKTLHKGKNKIKKYLKEKITYKVIFLI